LELSSNRQNPAVPGKAKGKPSLKGASKLLDGINFNQQEDHLWKAFVYGGLTDEDDMELIPRPGVLNMKRRAGKKLLGEIPISPRDAGSDQPPLLDMAAKSRLVGGREGKQPLGKPRRLLRPELKDISSPIASPVALVQTRIEGSVQK
jgi:hypothetical protein